MPGISAIRAAMALANSSSSGFTAKDTNSITLNGSIGFHRKTVTNFNTCKVGRAAEADTMPIAGSPSRISASSNSRLLSGIRQAGRKAVFCCSSLAVKTARSLSRLPRSKTRLPSPRAGRLSMDWPDKARCKTARSVSSSETTGGWMDSRATPFSCNLASKRRWANGRKSKGSFKIILAIGCRRLPIAVNTA